MTFSPDGVAMTTIEEFQIVLWYDLILYYGMHTYRSLIYAEKAKILETIHSEEIYFAMFIS